MRSLRGADGLRAIACLMVIFHHLTQKINIEGLPTYLRDIANFFITGSCGVSVFFILSGFLLSVPFWEAYLNGEKCPNLKIYAARRAGRIMPGFLVNMFFCFFLGLFMFPEAPSLVWRYLSGVTFTSSFHWLTFFPSEMNGPLWSIGFEVVSYILMPLGMMLLFRFLDEERDFKKAIIFWLKLWVVVFIANELILAFVEIDKAGKGWQFGVVGGAKWWMPRYNPIGMFGHFAIGVIAAGFSVWCTRMAPNWKIAQKWHLFDLASLVCFGLWLALLAGRAGESDFSFNLQDQPYYYPFFPAITAALLACLTQSTWMGKIFDNPVSRFIARISFGLYLWHYLVMLAIEAVYPDYVYGNLNDLGLWALLAVITLAASIAIAAASWYWFEKPILQRVQAWKPRPQGVAFRWTRFSSFAVAAMAFLVLVPPVVATVVRPVAWTFPKPYFPDKNDDLVIPTGKSTITVHIKGARNDQGTIFVSLYIHDFSPFNLVSRQSVPAGPDAVVEFTDVPFGEYSIMGTHDENYSGKMEFNGRFPAEGIITASKPKDFDDFETYKFFFNKPDWRLDYQVYYYKPYVGWM